MLKELAFRQLPTEVKGEKSHGRRRGDEAQGVEQDPVQPTELDLEKLRIVVDTVREQRIVDIQTVLGRLGSGALRDALLRSVEAHPNLKAHPGPRTIFLQWRITP
jgi:hypothetical protein